MCWEKIATAIDEDEIGEEKIPFENLRLFTALVGLTMCVHLNSLSMYCRARTINQSSFVANGQIYEWKQLKIVYG